MSPPIVIYAELLSNIRQVSIAVSLSSPSTQGTIAEISTDGLTLRILHDGSSRQLTLPSAVTAPRFLHIQQNSLELSWRLPRRDSDRDGTLEPIENQAIPWPASELDAPDCQLQCRGCGSVLIQPGRIHSWKDLPSENWAEMMEFWHCHKPAVPDQEDHHHLTSRGYGANSSMAATKGVGFVDLTSFLVSEIDCSGVLKVAMPASANRWHGHRYSYPRKTYIARTLVPDVVETEFSSSGFEGICPGPILGISLEVFSRHRSFGISRRDILFRTLFHCADFFCTLQYSSSTFDHASSATTEATAALDTCDIPDSITDLSIFCHNCRARVGIFNSGTQSVSLFKWTLKVNSSKIVSLELPRVPHCLVSSLLSAVSRSACSKSIIKPQKVDEMGIMEDATNPGRYLHLWILNNGIKFSSSNTKQVFTAIKVLYRTVGASEAHKLVESIMSDVQELRVPLEVINQTKDVLIQTNRILPASQRRFQGWDNAESNVNLDVATSKCRDLAPQHLSPGICHHPTLEEEEKSVVLFPFEPPIPLEPVVDNPRGSTGVILSWRCKGKGSQKVSERSEVDKCNESRERKMLRDGCLAYLIAPALGSPRLLGLHGSWVSTVSTVSTVKTSFADWESLGPVGIKICSPLLWQDWPFLVLGRNERPNLRVPFGPDLWLNIAKKPDARDEFRREPASDLGPVWNDAVLVAYGQDMGARDTSAARSFLQDPMAGGTMQNTMAKVGRSGYSLVESSWTSPATIKATTAKRPNMHKTVLDVKSNEAAGRQDTNGEGAMSSQNILPSVLVGLDEGSHLAQLVLFHIKNWKNDGRRCAGSPRRNDEGVAASAIGAVPGGLAEGRHDGIPMKNAICQSRSGWEGQRMFEIIASSPPDPALLVGSRNTKQSLRREALGGIYARGNHVLGPGIRFLLRGFDVKTDLHLSLIIDSKLPMTLSYSSYSRSRIQCTNLVILASPRLQNAGPHGAASTITTSYTLRVERLAYAGSTGLAAVVGHPDASLSPLPRPMSAAVARMRAALLEADAILSGSRFFLTARGDAGSGSIGTEGHRQAALYQSAHAPALIVNPSPALVLASCLVLGCSVSSFIHRRQDHDPAQTAVFATFVVFAVVLGRAGLGANANFIVLGCVPWALCAAMPVSLAVHFFTRRLEANRRAKADYFKRGGDKEAGDYCNEKAMVAMKPAT
ncbi:hypothetical protein MKZ38_000393 [Zalerion maritima]|uniref:Uncharacterized protein n=1 Tax=Zalerion maritima TaxID=339359 RepID=A0AAD5WTR7_9PEZI|nr:hypothetical protein MKZ38_000393 [Zalerion maritima]